MKYASTLVATTNDNAVDLIGPQPGPITNIVIINTTAAGGWFKVGTGAWCYLPASSAVNLPAPSADLPLVQIKRIASGTNITCAAWAY